MAAALVPLAITSGTWTTFLLASSTTSSDAQSLSPDRVSPPAAPIEAPASLAAVRRSAAGLVAPDASAASAGDDGIPAVALAAYQRAATVVDQADPACHLGWPLLAAIGRVESDHGRHAGSHLTENGVARPPILGPVLDGAHGTSRIADTDGGLFDGNKRLDRAVGPMQFIPSTWLLVGVDGNGDGQRDPQDINDAALAAAVYLCSGEGDLSTTRGADAAVYRYNHSTAYVELVTRIARAYSAAGYASRVYDSYAPLLPSLDFDPAPTRTRHHHAATSPEAATGGQSTSATPPGTATAGTEHPAAPAPAGDEAGSVPSGPTNDPVTQVVTTAQSTVSDLLDQSQGLLDDSQGLLQALLPTP
jgi:hypothetical protein